MRVIREELAQLRDQYGDKRRTEIREGFVNLNKEDLIAQEDMVVTLSHAGYVKSQPLADYRSQRRGGRGKMATTVKEEDFVDRLLIANTHDTVLCFSSLGKVYWIKVYDIPVASRGARGRPIVNILRLAEGEKISAILPVREYEEGRSVFMAASDGQVKKTALTEFSRPRPSGLIAVGLAEGERLIGVGITDGSNDILIFSSGGKVVRFAESDVREMGRTARGVRGISLRDGEKVVSLLIVGSGDETATVLTATENGYGKRTALAEYMRHNRGGSGAISIQVTERNGNVVGADLVGDDDEVMLITSGGTMIRTRTKEISVIGRNTQGVRLMDLDEGEKLVGIEKVVEKDTE
jgi:DNA gyrase subunit A